MSDPKLIIVMRADLSMRKGKIMAQTGHSVQYILVPLLKRLFSDPENPPSPVVLEWLSNKRSTKIGVRVDSEAELLEIYAKAEAAGLTAVMVEDLGLTEFHGQLTKTCCAIGPAFAEEIDPVTGHLKPF